MKPALPLHLWTERDLAGHVVELARIGGWRRYHTYSSKRSQHGFPDYILLKDNRLVVAELKSQKGRVRDAQQEWLDAFSKVPGCRAFLWRPSDLQEIGEVLLGRKPIVREAA